MGSDVTVVDTYSGAGGLTRAFLELPNVRKVIAIEDAFRYNNILRVKFPFFSFSTFLEFLLFLLHSSIRLVQCN